MVIIMTMIVVNIYEAKAKLSEYLDAVATGERVVICKRNHPVAELRAVDQKRMQPRPIGGAKGQVSIPPSFFEPMPDEFLDAFESGPVYSQPPAPARVAERRATYGSARKRRRRK
jgi:prevent-host-death family protein